MDAINSSDPSHLAVAAAPFLASRPETNAEVRSVVFAHLAGLVVAPTLAALEKGNVLHLLKTASWVDFDQLAEHSKANRGYLRIALRLAVGAGWLAQRPSAGPQQFALTGRARAELADVLPLFREAAAFGETGLEMDALLFGSPSDAARGSFTRLVSRVKERWGRPECGPAGRVTMQLDATAIGPIMVALSRRGVFDHLEHGPIRLSSLGANPELHRAFELLALLGWVSLEKGSAALTTAGSYAAQIAPAYGVTVSYLSRLSTLDLLLYGDPLLPRVDSAGNEISVDRAMNVWGSGGAHKTYFKRVDEIVIEIFNRPLRQQPRGICDMGCGDGTFLTHLYSVIRDKTARGQVLDSHPLIVIGADYSEVACRITRKALEDARIPIRHVVFGDINRPALLAADFERLQYDIHEFFHVRSFLDHNRPYIKPEGYAAGTRHARTTGAFAHLGRDIAPDELEENLVRHLRRWAPYVGRFGLLCLELHTLRPELTAANLDRTPALAYDGTHGYSDQYLVELPVFLSCAFEAGLVADLHFQTSFPASELATVSINLFTPRIAFM